METSFLIDFEPVGRRGHCPSGRSLLDCSRQLGVELINVCGGRGTCGHCRVQLISGPVSPPTSSEMKALGTREIAEGYRLACQARPLGNCKVRVPAESLATPQRTQIEGLEVAAPPEPVVRSHAVQLAPPALPDPAADSAQLLAALRQSGAICHGIDIEVLRTISPRLREWEWQVSASVRDGEVVALGRPGDRQLGLAVDLGTTKIAGYLVDLDSGQVLASRGAMNPQIAYGEDVMTRIARAAGATEEAARLQEMVVAALDQMAGELCGEAGLSPEMIVDSVIVGNTAMHHLLLRLPVEQLGLAPYVPAVSEALDIKARDIGLHFAPGAYVHLLPNIAGFVGADHVAMLLAAGVAHSEGVVLAVDIGTNSEACLVSDGRMTSVSCAAGPAFEGAHIRHGMRATSGAIERLRLVDGEVECHTIGGVPPVGLCGSGILDAIAHLRRAGVLDATGRMTEHPRIRTMDGRREFVLAGEQEGRPAITITQQDVRELQLAKGAVRAGVQVLLEAAGRSEEEIDRVIIAGAFGTYIDVSSALTIGMFPPLPLERFRQVGNAAGMGARLALISRSRRAEAQAIARRVGYIELGAVPRFANIFAQAVSLG
ncbi:MAG: DUF4445 domain-containing protein [Chloroflexi bacterium]|nr:DUF4445 domain-containing protein [Chloroflexota bacterium]